MIAIHGKISEVDTALLNYNWINWVDFSLFKGNLVDLFEKNIQNNLF